MARRHARGSFIRPAPRTKMWIGWGVGQTTVIGNADQVVSTLSAGVLLLRPFTILRTRAVVTWESDQTAATERPLASLGEIVVTETAAALGTTALPDPSGITGDADADWYIWQALMAPFVFASAIGFQSGAGIQYIIDSKAMRKVGPQDDSVTIVSEDNNSGAFLTTNGRQLIQLH